MQFKGHTAPMEGGHACCEPAQARTQPAGADQLNDASADARSIVIRVDPDRLHARAATQFSVIDVHILSCVVTNHLYAATGDAMLSLRLGNPLPPNTFGPRLLQAPSPRHCIELWRGVEFSAGVD